MIDYFNSRVGAINKQFEESKAAMLAGTYDEALFSLYQANQMVQEADILLKARIAFHIPLNS